MVSHKQTTTHVVPAKPRNPFLVAALMRRAGSHDKSPKAARQQVRQRFQRALDGLLRGDRTEFDLD